MKINIIILLITRIHLVESLKYNFYYAQDSRSFRLRRIILDL